MLSRRRRIARYYRIGLGVALALTLLFLVLARRVVPAPAAASHTVRLQCLSPEQAMALLQPIIPPSVSISTQASSRLGIIQVTASPKEMERVRTVLDRYDTPAASQSGVQLTLPKDIKAP
jgi:type II secretory pathway component GspD/PulD (secretin)